MYNCRALLHFLDPDKFRSKDDFVQKYKNLSSFNETEVSLCLYFFFLGHDVSVLFSLFRFSLKML